MNEETKPADLAQRVAELEAERDAMRAKYDELLVALHGIGAALGISEGDRSPYSVTCGVLERVNRLAEIEAQELDKRRHDITLNAAQLRRALDFAAPDFDGDKDQRRTEVSIGWREAGEVLDDDGRPDPAGYVAWMTEYPEEGCIPLLESFESTTAPAQAVPDGWKLVPVDPTSTVNVVMDREHGGLTFAPDKREPVLLTDEAVADACFYAMPPGAREWDTSSTGYGDTLGDAIVTDGWVLSAGSRRRDLVKAGALILAEIERMDRAAAPEHKA